MKNLAPTIYRQHLVVEGKSSFKVTDQHIRDYLSNLSDEIGMRTLIEPITHKSDKFGWAGWIHWETSGAHFYAWDEPFPFFSVDIYTCKEFDVETAVNFTREFFKSEEIEFKSF